MAGIPGADDVPWPVNGGVDNIRYSPLTQINADNVAKLKVAWTYDSHDAFKGSEMQSNPIVVDGVLYATTPTLKVVALDAATGQRDLEVRSERRRRERRAVPPSRRHASTTIACSSPTATGCMRSTARRDSRSRRSARDGRIDLREGLGMPAERASVSASTPGADLRGSAHHRQQRPGDAARHARPHPRVRREHRQAALDRSTPSRSPASSRYDTWPPDAYKLIGGANAWAGVTVDAKHAMVFAATGSASFDFYGVNRHGDNLFANCVLALDARTGKRIWHFQGIRHDVWDWDFPAAPNLVTVTRNGRKVDAVAQITKYRLRLRARSQDRRSRCSRCSTRKVPPSDG